MFVFVVTRVPSGFSSSIDRAYVRARAARALSSEKKRTSSICNDFFVARANFSIRAQKVKTFRAESAYLSVRTLQAAEVRGHSSGVRAGRDSVSESQMS